VAHSCRSRGFPLAREQRGGSIGKDRSEFTEHRRTRKSARERDGHAVRESRRTPRELEAELEKLAQYGKPVKKAESAPVPKAKKTEDAREPKEQVAKAA
jgi:hypothetical protein